ncbi:copper chaperone PCu(A)C [Cardiobacteriaceae bacterium TAE3-ERU3]|nr:copper chaperone PCu(A)C [Cardiobacteriaceae bacterium TAE3-ERU3]
MVVRKLILLTGLGIISFAQAAVRTEQAFVATPIPGTHLTAVYGNFINDSEEALYITHLSSDSSEAAEIHEQTIDSNDIARMRPIEKIAIPAHDTLVLSKGGEHLMLINLNKKLRDHDEVTLTLYFEQGEPQQITLPVLRSASQLNDENQ